MTRWPVGNAPCSWGTIENTGTEDARIDAMRFLDELAETGYAGTELGDLGFLPTDPDRLAEALSSRGLDLIASWVTVRLDDPGQAEPDVARALEVARLIRTVGGDDAVLNLGPDHSRVPDRTRYAGRILPAHGLGEREMDQYAEGADRVARAVRDETGLRCAFHAHGASYVETPAEIEAFLDRTDPALVGLCFDTGHVALGGGDPAPDLERYGDRIALVHLKDFSPEVVAEAELHGWDYPEMVRQGVFPELGQGIVDFPAVLERLRTQDYRGWLVVEQDVLPGLGSPKESAARNRSYLKELGL